MGSPHHGRMAALAVGAWLIMQLLLHADVDKANVALGMFIFAHKRWDCQRLQSVSQRTICYPTCSFACSATCRSGICRLRRIRY